MIFPNEHVGWYFDEKENTPCPLFFILSKNPRAIESVFQMLK